MFIRRIAHTHLPTISDSYIRYYLLMCFVLVHTQFRHISQQRILLEFFHSLFLSLSLSLVHSLSHTRACMSSSSICLILTLLAQSGERNA